jgi:hypothetical protein
MLLKVKNAGSSALTETDAAYSIHNFHVGGGRTKRKTRRSTGPERGLFTERSGRVLFAARSRRPATTAAPPTTPTAGSTPGRTSPTTPARAR